MVTVTVMRKMTTMEKLMMKMVTVTVMKMKEEMKERILNNTQRN